MKPYWHDVFTSFLAGYSQNETPNPDILCNTHIKFGTLLNTCLAGEKDLYLATGHYCGVQSVRSQHQLLRGVDPQKDQSYFLSAVDRTSLARVLFPLSGLNKAEVKALAEKEIGLPAIAAQPESMGICFIGKRRRFADFLAQYLPATGKGPFVDALTQKTLGQHDGVIFHTIGQCARIGGLTERHFVLRKELATNTVYVVPAR